jgi:hypothetical protein
MLKRSCCILEDTVLVFLNEHKKGRSDIGVVSRDDDGPWRASASTSEYILTLPSSIVNISVTPLLAGTPTPHGWKAAPVL